MENYKYKVPTRRSSLYIRDPEVVADIKKSFRKHGKTASFVKLCLDKLNVIKPSTKNSYNTSECVYDENMKYHLKNSIFTSTKCVNYQSTEQSTLSGGDGNEEEIYISNSTDKQDDLNLKVLLNVNNYARSIENLKYLCNFERANQISDCSFNKQYFVYPLAAHFSDQHGYAENQLLKSSHLTQPQVPSYCPGCLKKYVDQTDHANCEKNSHSSKGVFRENRPYSPFSNRPLANHFYTKPAPTCCSINYKRRTGRMHHPVRSQFPKRLRDSKPCNFQKAFLTYVEVESTFDKSDPQRRNGCDLSDNSFSKHDALKTIPSIKQKYSSPSQTDPIFTRKITKNIIVKGFLNNICEEVVEQELLDNRVKQGSEVTCSEYSSTIPFDNSLDPSLEKFFFGRVRKSNVLCKDNCSQYSDPINVKNSIAVNTSRPFMLQRSFCAVDQQISAHFVSKDNVSLCNHEQNSCSEDKKESLSSMLDVATKKSNASGDAVFENQRSSDTLFPRTQTQSIHRLTTSKETEEHLSKIRSRSESPTRRGAFPEDMPVKDCVVAHGLAFGKTFIESVSQTKSNVYIVEMNSQHSDKSVNVTEKQFGETVCPTINDKHTNTSKLLIKADQCTLTELNNNNFLESDEKVTQVHDLSAEGATAISNDVEINNVVAQMQNQDSFPKFLASQNFNIIRQQMGEKYFLPFDKSDMNKTNAPILRTKPVIVNAVAKRRSTQSAIHRRSSNFSNKKSKNNKMMDQQVPQTTHNINKRKEFRGCCMPMGRFVKKEPKIKLADNPGKVEQNICQNRCSDSFVQTITPSEMQPNLSKETTTDNLFINYSSDSTTQTISMVTFMREMSPGPVPNNASDRQITSENILNNNVANIGKNDLKIKQKVKPNVDLKANSQNAIGHVTNINPKSLIVKGKAIFNSTSAPLNEPKFVTTEPSLVSIESTTKKRELLVITNYQKSHETKTSGSSSTKSPSCNINTKTSNLELLAANAAESVTPEEPGRPSKIPIATYRTTASSRPSTRQNTPDNVPTTENPTTILVAKPKTQSSPPLEPMLKHRLLRKALQSSHELHRKKNSLRLNAIDSVEPLIVNLKTTTPLPSLVKKASILPIHELFRNRSICTMNSHNRILESIAECDDEIVITHEDSVLNLGECDGMPTVDDLVGHSSLIMSSGRGMGVSLMSGQRSVPMSQKTYARNGRLTHTNVGPMTFNTRRPNAVSDEMVKGNEALHQNAPSSDPSLTKLILSNSERWVLSRIVFRYMWSLLKRRNSNFIVVLSVYKSNVVADNSIYTFGNTCAKPINKLKVQSSRSLDRRGINNVSEIHTTRCCGLIKRCLSKSVKSIKSENLAKENVKTKFRTYVMKSNIRPVSSEITQFNVLPKFSYDPVCKISSLIDKNDLRPIFKEIGTKLTIEQISAEMQELPKEKVLLPKKEEEQQQVELTSAESLLSINIQPEYVEKPLPDFGNEKRPDVDYKYTIYLPDDEPNVKDVTGTEDFRKKKGAFVYVRCFADRFGRRTDVQIKDYAPTLNILKKLANCGAETIKKLENESYTNIVFVCTCNVTPSGDKEKPVKATTSCQCQGLDSKREASQRPSLIMNMPKPESTKNRLVLTAEQYKTLKIQLDAIIEAAIFIIQKTMNNSSAGNNTLSWRGIPNHCRDVVKSKRSKKRKCDISSSEGLKNKAGSWNWKCSKCHKYLPIQELQKDGHARDTSNAKPTINDVKTVPESNRHDEKTLLTTGKDAATQKGFLSKFDNDIEVAEKKISAELSLNSTVVKEINGSLRVSKGTELETPETRDLQLQTTESDENMSLTVFEEILTCCCESEQCSCGRYESTLSERAKDVLRQFKKLQQIREIYDGELFDAKCLFPECCECNVESRAKCNVSDRRREQVQEDKLPSNTESKKDSSVHKTKVVKQYHVLMEYQPIFSVDIPRKSVRISKNEASGDYRLRRSDFFKFPCHYPIQIYRTSIGSPYHTFPNSVANANINLQSKLNNMDFLHDFFEKFIEEPTKLKPDTRLQTPFCNFDQLPQNLHNENTYITANMSLNEQCSTNDDLPINTNYDDRRSNSYRRQFQNRSWRNTETIFRPGIRNIRDVCLYVPSDTEDTDNEKVELEFVKDHDEQTRSFHLTNVATTGYMSYLPCFCRPTKSLTNQETFSRIASNKSHNEVAIQERCSCSCRPGECNCCNTSTNCKHLHTKSAHFQYPYCEPARNQILKSLESVRKCLSRHLASCDVVNLENDSHHVVNNRTSTSSTMPSESCSGQLKEKSLDVIKKQTNKLRPKLKSLCKLLAGDVCQEDGIGMDDEEDPDGYKYKVTITLKSNTKPKIIKDEDNEMLKIDFKEISGGAELEPAENAQKESKTNGYPDSLYNKTKGGAQVNNRAKVFGHDRSHSVELPKPRQASKSALVETHHNVKDSGCPSCVPKEIPDMLLTNSQIMRKQHAGNQHSSSTSDAVESEPKPHRRESSHYVEAGISGLHMNEQGTNMSHGHVKNDHTVSQQKVHIVERHKEDVGHDSEAQITHELYKNTYEYPSSEPVQVYPRATHIPLCGREEGVYKLHPGKLFTRIGSSLARHVSPPSTTNEVCSHEENCGAVDCQMIRQTDHHEIIDTHAPRPTSSSSRKMKYGCSNYGQDCYEPDCQSMHPAVKYKKVCDCGQGCSPADCELESAGHPHPHAHEGTRYITAMDSTGEYHDAHNGTMYHTALDDSRKYSFEHENNTPVATSTPRSSLDAGNVRHYKRISSTSEPRISVDERCNCTVRCKKLYHPPLHLRQVAREDIPCDPACISEKCNMDHDEHYASYLDPHDQTTIRVHPDVGQCNCLQSCQKRYKLTSTGRAIMTDNPNSDGMPCLSDCTDRRCSPIYDEPIHRKIPSQLSATSSARISIDEECNCKIRCHKLYHPPYHLREIKHVDMLCDDGCISHKCNPSTLAHNDNEHCECTSKCKKLYHPPYSVKGIKYEDVPCDPGCSNKKCCVHKDVHYSNFPMVSEDDECRCMTRCPSRNGSNASSSHTRDVEPCTLDCADRKCNILSYDGTSKSTFPKHPSADVQPNHKDHPSASKLNFLPAEHHDSHTKTEHSTSPKSRTNTAEKAVPSKETIFGNGRAKSCRERVDPNTRPRWNPYERQMSCYKNQNSRQVSSTTPREDWENWKSKRKPVTCMGGRRGRDQSRRRNRNVGESLFGGTAKPLSNHHEIVNDSNAKRTLKLRPDENTEILLDPERLERDNLEVILSKETDDDRKIRGKSPAATIRSDRSYTKIFACPRVQQEQKIKVTDRPQKINVNWVRENMFVSSQEIAEAKPKRKVCDLMNLVKELNSSSSYRKKSSKN